MYFTMRQWAGGPVELAAVMPQKMVGEQGNVSFALAQGGEVDWHFRETVIEIPPESPLLDGLLEIDIGGSDDVSFHRDILAPADGHELLFFDDAQQLGLKVGLDFGYFIQKDCSFAGQAKVTGCGVLRVSKGTFFVPEELAFEKRFRNARAVYPDEGPIRVAGMIVDEAGQDVFSSARFTPDENVEPGEANLA